MAGASDGNGYDVLGDNCADNAGKVLAKCGLRNLPLLQFHPSPNDWYIHLVDIPDIDWSTSAPL